LKRKQAGQVDWSGLLTTADQTVKVQLEIFDHDERWAPVGQPLSQDAALESLTGEGEGQRLVFTFGWVQGVPGLWRATGGQKAAAVANLRDGPIEFELSTPRFGTKRMRVRLVE
jgi:hypothetical protein